MGSLVTKGLLHNDTNMPAGNYDAMSYFMNTVSNHVPAVSFSASSLVE